MVSVSRLVWEDITPPVKRSQQLFCPLDNLFLFRHSHHMTNILASIQAQGRSVSEVARSADLSRAVLYQIAHGQDPKLSTVVKLSAALGVRPGDLFPELGQ
jgi:DNA-binding phage protein